MSKSTKATASDPRATCPPEDEFCRFQQPAAPVPTGDGGNTAPIPNGNEPAATGSFGVILIPTSAPGDQPFITSGIVNDGSTLAVPEATSTGSGGTISFATGVNSSSKGGSNLSGGAVAGVAIGS
jgi:hypothetical protein